MLLLTGSAAANRIFETYELIFRDYGVSLAGRSRMYYDRIYMMFRILIAFFCNFSISPGESTGFPLSRE